MSGNSEPWFNLLIISIRVVAGILITFGLPVLWLAWRRKKSQQPTFEMPLEKAMLVLFTFVTAMSITGLYAFNLNSLHTMFLFPVGLYGFVTGGRGGFGFMSFIALVIGWLTYFGLSLAIIFAKNKQTARFLYLIFILILMANIGGCAQFIVLEMGNEGW